MTTNTNAALREKLIDLIAEQLADAILAALSTAAQPPAEGALNTIAAMFHSGEEIEGPDGMAMMVDMSAWNDALDAFDEIIGLLHFKKAEKFPHLIKVDSIEILPEKSDARPLASLRGIAPEAYGGLVSTEYVEKVRNGEWKQIHHIEEFGLFCDYSEFEQIARAIELAHGIKPTEQSND